MQVLQSRRTIKGQSKGNIEGENEFFSSKPLQNLGFMALALIAIEKQQGGESRGLNDSVHGISCRYADKTCKKIELYFH